jgi:hypothetical protein
MRDVVVPGRHGLHWKQLADRLVLQNCQFLEVAP